MYAVLFFLSAVAAWVMLDPEVSKGLMKMDKYVGTAACKSDDFTCREAWSELGVMRIMFAVALFHGFFSLLTVGVKSSKDGRSALHNGMWMLKIILLAGIMVGAFFIGNKFFVAWSWVGLVGAFLFMLVQFVLLVDFAHAWNEKWVGRAEEGSKCAGAGLVGFSIGLFIASLVISILLFVFYAHSDTGNACHTSKFLISFNMVLSLIVTVASVNGRVREAMPSSGILQAGVVTFYSTYLMWSAVSGVPNDCSSSSASSMATTAVGALITFISVAYASIRTSSHTHMGKLGLKEDEGKESLYLMDDGDVDSDDEERGGQRVVDNEKDGVAYSWSFFHLTFAVAALYLMEVLTEWSTFHDGAHADVKIGTGWASVWVQAVSSWLVMLLYFWTLVAPIVLPDRDFS
jgi:hypothetical protein